MRYDPNEQFAGNASINADIREILASICEPSRSRMRKRILQDYAALLNQRTDDADAAARHTFREFLVAHRLNSNGYHLEYSATINGQTPDWYDASSGLMIEVFTCERGGTSDPVKRTTDRIAEKADKYATMVSDRGLSFVVAVHGDFVSGVDSDDCEQAIRNSHLFDVRPDLSGVIFFAESNFTRARHPDGAMILTQQYEYSYFANPCAIRPIDLKKSLIDEQSASRG